MDYIFEKYPFLPPQITTLKWEKHAYMVYESLMMLLIFFLHLQTHLKLFGISRTYSVTQNNTKDLCFKE